METVSTSQPRTNGGAPAADLTLAALAARPYAELERVYRNGRCATTMRALDGALKGRMLAVRFLDDSPIAPLLRAFAASSAFVWDGKTFEARSDTEGRGINRVQIPGALGRQNLFPFETRFGPSLLDGQPALILDYDLPENPAWIRKIHDEVREVSPGLYLGPAMWKGATAATTVLWFALDTRGRS